MEFYYSQASRGFYIAEIHGAPTITIPDPNAPGSSMTVRNPDTMIPADAIPVSEQEHAALIQAQSEGSLIQVVNGAVVAIPPAAMTLDQMRAIVFVEAREIRTVILNALTGMGYRAMLTSLLALDGDVLTAARQMAQDAAAAQLQLLDVTKDPRVLAVTVQQGPQVLRQVILAVYKEYRVNTPVSVRSAYNEAM